MDRWMEGMRWAALAGAAALALGGCGKQEEAAAPAASTQQAAAARPECPARQDSIIIDSAHVRHAFPQGTLAGPTSNVPEYHDCQRLLEGNSGTYGPLVGVWAAYHVTARFSNLARDSTPVAVAELFNWDQAYGRLGIQQYFNCLYVRSSGGGLVAEMVPVGTDNTGCREARSHWGPGHPLRVNVEQLDDSAPPVARWEWSSTGVQYIGIACGPKKWCRIGPPEGFRRDSLHTESELADVPQAVASRPGRRLLVAGWYDEQRLAPPSGPPAAATDVRAIVVPHERLGQYVYADFENKWAPVAFVRFETGSGHAPIKHEVRVGYADKLGFATGDTTSVISLCRGLEECPRLRTVAADSLLQRLPAAYRHPTPVSAQEVANGASQTVPNVWWARITAGSRVTYRPVIRCDHSSLRDTVPGTARWRWSLDDEKVWVRCVNGCCEVQGGM